MCVFTGFFPTETWIVRGERHLSSLTNSEVYYCLRTFTSWSFSQHPVQRLKFWGTLPQRMCLGFHECVKRLGWNPDLPQVLVALSSVYLLRALGLLESWGGQRAEGW